MHRSLRLRDNLIDKLVSRSVREERERDREEERERGREGEGESLLFLSFTGGGRRVRGGRGRISQTSSSPSMEGPSLEELISTGIRVDTLKQLMARKETEDSAADHEDSSGDEGKVKKLIALDQVTLRGEDLTSKLSSDQNYCVE